MIALDDFDMLSEHDDYPPVQSTLLGLAKRGWLVGLHILPAGFNVELRRFNNSFIQQFAQDAVIWWCAASRASVPGRHRSGGRRLAA